MKPAAVERVLHAVDGLAGDLVDEAAALVRLPSVGGTGAMRNLHD